MTVTRIWTREEEAAATSEDSQKSDHESFVNGEEEEEEDSTLDREKRKRDIADWIGWPSEPTSRNKDEEAEG